MSGSLNPLNWFSSPNVPASLGPNSIYDPGAQTVQGMQDPQQSIAWGSPAGAGGAGGLGSGLGWNVGTGQLALGGLAALGNLWSASQANGLARQQFDFTKGVTNTNMANQIKSYNTALSDRARSRGAVEGQSPDQVQDYVNRNSMSR